MTNLPDSAPFSREGTSEAAAEAIEPVLGKLRREVYALFQEVGADGATDEQVQIRLGLDGSTERPRRWELERAGLVVDSGRRRETISGRKAIVWILKKFLDTEQVSTC